MRLWFPSLTMKRAHAKVVILVHIRSLEIAPHYNNQTPIITLQSRALSALFVDKSNSMFLLFLCRVLGPVYGSLDGTRDAILARIELASDNAILGKGPANFLAY